MAGVSQYTKAEIRWILAQLVRKKAKDDIKEGFESRFGKSLGDNQLRYIKNKYGRDPEFE
jgi:hypothetical protein